ncbi:hypothetical protein EYF80_060919 [Liparis tanakae]|uniref:Uncharacterized protein n=1 Tax=Liparis tanakae TaxID=230148 RepID=A0A4Z2EJD5_9TELE|nr:hypothetical protein EYF80_060919 [Liparis tanakae]
MWDCIVGKERSLSCTVQQTEGARRAEEAVTALAADDPGATRLCLCFIPLLPCHGNLRCFLSSHHPPPRRLLIPGVKSSARWTLAMGKLGPSPRGLSELSVADVQHLLIEQDRRLATLNAPSSRQRRPCPVNTVRGSYELH